MRSEIQTAELATGVTLEYTEQGDPSGVPVLLLHGLSDSRRSFERVLPHLPASIRALAVTQRGHGDSGKPESGYTADDFAADAAAFMDALDRGKRNLRGDEEVRAATSLCSSRARVRS